jgi:hypothetical protein
MPARLTPHATDPTRPSKARPDPTPMRVAVGIGGLATLSGLVTAIFVVPAAAPVTDAATSAPASPATVTQQRPVVYVQLKPGQTAPPGATVIDAKAPKPVTVVTRVAAPAQKIVVVHTTQSGKVVP